MYPPKQKPPDLDDAGQPIKFDQKPPDLDDYGNPSVETPGLGSQIWGALNEGLWEAPSRWGKQFADWMTTPELDDSKFTAMAKGAVGGMGQGLGQLATDLTSPINIGATLATGGSNLALRAGLRPEVVKGISTAAKALSVPAAAHGGMEMGGAATDFFDPNIPLTETAGRFGRGAIEAAGGTLGALHTPNTQGPILSRLWPDTEAKAAASVSDLLPKLRESLDKDATRRGGPPPSPEAVKDPELQVDPNINNGIGDPMLAGTGVDNRPKPKATKVFIKTPSPELVNHVKTQGYDFVGVDPNRGMVFERRRPAPVPPERVPDIEEFETVKEEAPDINQFEDEPMFSRVPQPGQEPQFAFMDDMNFPEGPEPFFHLPDGSTVSARELVRRGMEVPQLPDEQLGIGRQFPGIEAEDIGPMTGQPIDLNQAVLEMGSDMARPVDFGQQVLGPDTGMQARNLEHQLQAIEEGPVVPQPTPRPQPEPPLLPPEFQPDIPMTKEPVPETGGYSPRFGEQVLPDEGPLFSRVKPGGPQGPGEGNLFAGSEGRGLGKESFEQQWQTAVSEARTLGIDYTKYDNLDQLQWDITRETARQTVETGRNPLSGATDEGPQFAKVGQNRAQISVNVRHAADELTKGYNRALPGVMVRESLQNAFDAVKNMGGSGKVQIRLNRENNSLQITDNGKGMSPDELFTVFTNLHESGKSADPNATGGKGVGKATYMLGGEHFTVETVKQIGGKKVASSFEGTPEQLLEGFDVDTTEVSPDTPTGTTITTKLKPEQSMDEARWMLMDITKKSRGLNLSLESDSHGLGMLPEVLGNKADDTSVVKDTLDNGNTAVELLIPKGASMGERSSIRLEVLNNGMYQYSSRLYLDEQTKGIPDEIIVDLTPKVPEGHDNYPFPVQRESIKEGLQKELESLIKHKLVNPFASQKKYDLAKLWDSMPIMGKDTLTNTEIVLFDPGNRLTPDELMELQTNPVMNDMNNMINQMVSDILATSQMPDWAKKVKRVGISLDPTYFGIHIPDPRSMKTDPSSAILVNPFAHLQNPDTGNFDLNARDASLDLVTTALHEVAHVGSQDPKNAPPITDADLTDPRVGRYLQTYLKQVMSQGGIDMGHGMPFIHRLGEIYAKFGTRNGLAWADNFQRIFEGGQSGGYSPEVQRLLSIYNESRGRAATTEDILSGTGVKSANRGQGGEGDVPGNVTGLGGGTPRTAILRGKHATPDAVKAMKERGYEFSHMNEHGSFVFTKAGMGGPPPPKSPILESEVPQPPGKKPKGEAEKISPWREAFELPRAMMSVDPPFVTSAMFRQGLPLVGTKGWFKAAFEQAKAFGSQKYYDQRMAELGQDPLFKPRGKKPSYAEHIGVAMTDMGSKLTRREEALRSKIAEKIPLYGKYIRASNRAFTLFLNELRVNTLNELVKTGRANAKADGNAALDPFQNEVLAKELAEFVNVATGRGSLKAQLPFTKKEYSAERASKLLADAFFSPRLIASRMKMMNPSTYIFGNPQVRKEYTKAMLRTVGAWWTFASIAEMMFGADVSKDPNNADFGKVKIGNTRFDAGGGFQQWLVLGSRMRFNWMKLPIETETGITPIDLMTNLMGHGGGKYTSSGSGASYDFGSGYKPETRTSIMINFLANKLHPTAKFFWDLGSANEQIPVYVGDRIMQMFLPMMAGDLAELAVEEPELIPLVLPFSGIGGGTQTYTGQAGKPSITPFMEQFMGMEGIGEYDIPYGR